MDKICKYIDKELDELENKVAIKTKTASYENERQILPQEVSVFLHRRNDFRY